MILKIFLLLICAQLYIILGYVAYNILDHTSKNSELNTFSKTVKWFAKKVEPETDLIIGGLFYLYLWLCLTLWPVIIVGYLIVAVFCNSVRYLMKHRNKN